MIMLGSAVFVLAALTMTGVYVRGNNEKEKQDGYTIDFSALMDETQDKQEEIAGYQVPAAGDQQAEGQKGDRQTARADQMAKPSQLAADDFMDYLPMEAEDGDLAAEAPVEEDAEYALAAEFSERDEDSVTTGGEAVSNTTQPALSFSENDRLAWPIVGNVLVNYSMDKTTYFATLMQYKYSPAIVIGAAEGKDITAAADGRVVDIYEDEEIGTAVVMDLGGGYELTYGQLKDLQVSKGAYVKQGAPVGQVAAPTKYYSVEGANVYFKLTRDGVPVNPMGQLD